MNSNTVTDSIACCRTVIHSSSRVSTWSACRHRKSSVRRWKKKVWIWQKRWQSTRNIDTYWYRRRSGDFVSRLSASDSKCRSEMYVPLHCLDQRRLRVVWSSRRVSMCWESALQLPLRRRAQADWTANDPPETNLWMTSGQPNERIKGCL